MLKNLIIFLLLAASGVFGGYTLTNELDKLGTVNFVGVLPTTLSGAGINSSVTNVPVSSLTIQQTGQKVSMSDFGTIGYATLEPGVATRQEFISFSGITQNSNGSAVLTGVTRGLSPVYPYTASTTMRFSHGGGTKVVVSNSPPFYSNFLVTSNTATVTAAYIYASTSLPGVALDTTDAQVSAATSTFATVNLLNGLSIAGAPNGSTIVKGIFEQAIATEASSSAATGATLANLVIGADLTTATPAASKVVMSQSTGKILQGWFDLAQQFIFSGGLLSTGSTTVNATTTIAADSLTNRALVLNGLAYRFPSGRAVASSTALLENGSGSLSFGIPGQVLIGNISTSTTGSPGNVYSTTTIAHNFGTVPRIVRVSYTSQGDSTVDNWTYGNSVATSTSQSTGTLICVGSSASTGNVTKGTVSAGQLAAVYAGEGANAQCANGIVYNVYLTSLTSTQAQIEVRYVSGKNNASLDMSYEIIQ